MNNWQFLPPSGPKGGGAYVYTPPPLFTSVSGRGIICLLPWWYPSLQDKTPSVRLGRLSREKLALDLDIYLIKLRNTIVPLFAIPRNVCSRSMPWILIYFMNVVWIQVSSVVRSHKTHFNLSSYMRVTYVGCYYFFVPEYLPDSSLIRTLRNRKRFLNRSAVDPTFPNWSTKRFILWADLKPRLATMKMRFLESIDSLIWNIVGINLQKMQLKNITEYY